MSIIKTVHSAVYVQLSCGHNYFITGEVKDVDVGVEHRCFECDTVKGITSQKGKMAIADLQERVARIEDQLIARNILKK